MGNRRASVQAQATAEDGIQLALSYIRQNKDTLFSSDTGLAGALATPFDPSNDAHTTIPTCSYGWDSSDSEENVLDDKVMCNALGNGYDNLRVSFRRDTDFQDAGGYRAGTLLVSVIAKLPTSINKMQAVVLQPMVDQAGEWVPDLTPAYIAAQTNVR